MVLAAPVQSLDETYRTSRLIHAGMIAAVFVYLGVCLALKSSSHGGLKPTLLAVFAMLGVWCAGGMLTFRAKFIPSSEEALRRNPADQKALSKWMAGQIGSMAAAEGVALWGVVAFFTGGTLPYVALFFAVSLLLLFICTPQKP